MNGLFFWFFIHFSSKIEIYFDDLLNDLGIFYVKKFETFFVKKFLLFEHVQILK